MGVGVYASDFNGSGGTFLIDGPLGGGMDAYREWVVEQYGRDAGVDFETWKRDVSDFEFGNGPPDDEEMQALNESYLDYLFSCGEDEAPGYENWLQDEADAFVEEMEAVLRQAAAGIGMTPSGSGRSAERADFDSDFVLAAEAEWVQVGWRGWEHDYVIGIGGTRRALRWVGDPDAYAGTIVELLGMSPDGFTNRYSLLAGAVENYFRLSLMQAGFECRYRTSGYTTAAYSEPQEGFEEAIAAAARFAGEAVALLGGSFEDNFPSASADERREIVGVVLAGDSRITEAVPLLDVARDQVRLYLPDRNRFHRTLVGSEAMAAVARAAAAPGAEFSEVPFDPSIAEDWNLLQRQATDHLVVSLGEFMEYESDLAVRWEDEDGEEWESDATPAAQALSAAPG